MSNLTEARMDTIQALLDGYNSLSVPRLLHSLSAEFTHRVLPRSLAMPVRNKESFSEHAAGIFSIFDRFRMIPEEVYEDEAQGVVIIHAQMEGTLKAAGRGKRQGDEEWRNECVMMVRLSADGTKVVEIQEFVDSAKAMEMRRKHAPKSFGGANGEGSGLRWVRNTMLFTCIAAGTFYGVRRLLHE